MRKFMYFDELWGSRWPAPTEIERYFLAKPGHEWFYTGGNDGARLSVEGLYGTGHLGIGEDRRQARVDADLMMWGNPKHGVLLIYSRWGGGYDDVFSSKGDMTRLRDIVYSLHETPLPVGLFIPFATAWRAVKEFIETDGELPKSIEWVANDSLPPNTFPDLFES